MNEKELAPCCLQLELFPRETVQTADIGKHDDVIFSVQLKNQKLEKRTNLESLKEVLGRCAARQLRLSFFGVSSIRGNDVLQKEVKKLSDKLFQHHRLSAEVAALLAGNITRWRLSSRRPSVPVIYTVLKWRIKSENRGRRMGDQLSCPSKRALYRILQQPDLRSIRRSLRRSKGPPRRNKVCLPISNNYG